MQSLLLFCHDLALGGPGRTRNRALPKKLSPHLEDLESESIYILREVAAQFAKSVLLYSIGGAGRDEEASRAKERIFSVRGPGHAWDPRRQRPEPWNLFNAQLAPGETMRIFPLSNWTELDVWDYVSAQDIAVVPLYFAAERPVVRRDGMLILVDDERLPLAA